MFVNLEHNEKHSIESYTDHSICTHGQSYQDSCIISHDSIETHWPIHSIQELNDTLLASVLNFKPKIILIGHEEMNIFAPRIVTETLIKQNIALEVMPIGSACRTFNILLSEKRPVALGIIFKNKMTGV